MPGLVPGIHVLAAKQDVDGRVIGERSDAVLWTATPGHDELKGDNQSSGSSFTIEAPWLEPAQNVTGLGELSTNTRRMLVVFGN